jgi:hypothetical protein
VPAMIDFNRRFDASHAALRASVAGGEVGTIELVQMTSRGPAVPPLDYIKVSGGQLRDRGLSLQRDHNSARAILDRAGLARAVASAPAAESHRL